MQLRRSGCVNHQNVEKAAALSGKVGNEEMTDRLCWIHPCDPILNRPGGPPF